MPGREGIAHAVALNLQEKGLPAAGPFPRKRVAGLDVLVGQNRSASRHPAEQGGEGSALLPAQVDSPSPIGRAREMAGPLQPLEMILDTSNVDLHVSGDLALPALGCAVICAASPTQ